MSNDLTAGDDYIAPCPSCKVKMNIGHITKANKLTPGYVDTCSSCGKLFQVDKIDYIPVVWLKKG